MARPLRRGMDSRMLARSTLGSSFIEGEGTLVRISSRRRVANSGCLANR